jgi:hypothetical protein
VRTGQGRLDGGLERQPACPFGDVVDRLHLAAGPLVESADLVADRLDRPVDPLAQSADLVQGPRS